MSTMGVACLIHVVECRLSLVIYNFIRFLIDQHCHQYNSRELCLEWIVSEVTLNTKASGDAACITTEVVACPMCT